jgi:hypothetical protein
MTRSLRVLILVGLSWCCFARVDARPHAPGTTIQLSPSALQFASYGPSSLLTFVASEAGFSGSFHVVAADPSVATPLTVTSEHRFVVLAKKDGATTFTVSDGLGRSAQLAVTVSGPLNRYGRLYVPVSYFPALRIFGLIPSAEQLVQYNFQSTPGKLAFTPSGDLYVSVSFGSTIDVIPLYPTLSRSGQPVPSRTLQVGGTVLSLTSDRAGNLFVAEEVGSTLEIAIYAPTASGNPAPLQTIQLPDPTHAGGAVALGSRDELYVSRPAANEVDVYAANPSKLPRKVRSIVGPSLSQPNGMAVDTSGELYVANYFPTNITVYAKDAHGPATPVRTISIKNLMGNCEIRELAVSGGYLYAVSDAVYQLVARQGGAQSPLAVIDSTSPNCFIQDAGVGP